jgi:outer membrane receptor for Fe3+-dicitrate
LGAAAPLSKVYDFSHTVSATNPSPALESPAKMQKSTTYQIGSVYKGNRITLDGDIYRVRFDNTYSSTTDTVTTDSTYGQEIWFLNPASITQGMEFGLLSRIWEKPRFAGILRFCESGYTRFHEGERLDEGTGLAWV